MLFQQQFIPGLAIASYIVGDERSGEAAVIDPTRDVSEIMAYAKANGLHIRHIIETHVHADFVSGACELKARLNGAPRIYCSGLGGERWTPTYADKIIDDGMALEMGDIRLRFLHSPGHTPEHITVALYDTSRSRDVPWLAFTGDFLFVGDVGRPDLLGEDEQQELAHQLYLSVFERMSGLPETMEVFPAHGAGSLCGKAIGSRRSSTLGYERHVSPAFQQKPETQWVEDLLADMPRSPKYFQRMKRINQEGPPVIGPELPGQSRWNAEQVHQRVCEDCVVLDVRSKEAFAAAHIPNAINIPFAENLPTWAGWVLPYDRPILLVLDDARQATAAVAHLVRVGLDDVQGYLEGGIDAWETAGFPVATLVTRSVQQLAESLQRKDNPTVLDVRTEKEWADGHIEGALHIHGGTLQDRIEEVPRKAPVAVICGSGYRATIAASFLQREGYRGVANIMGGMSAWMAAGLPTV